MITFENFVDETDVMRKLKNATKKINDFRFHVNFANDFANDFQIESKKNNNEIDDEITTFDNFIANAFFSIQTTFFLRLIVEIFSFDVFSIVEISFLRSFENFDVSFSRSFFFFETSCRRKCRRKFEKKNEKKFKKKTFIFSQKFFDVVKSLSKNVKNFLIKNIIESNVKS